MGVLLGKYSWVIIVPQCFTVCPVYLSAFISLSLILTLHYSLYPALYYYSMTFVNHFALFIKVAVLSQRSEIMKYKFHVVMSKCKQYPIGYMLNKKLNAQLILIRIQVMKNT